jgi:hypothetical protein
MYLKLLVFMCVLAAAACRETQPTPTLTATPTPQPTATEEAYIDDYVEVESNGVRLGISVPWGWKAHKTPVGLMMTEHYTSAPIAGMEVHIFVHTLTGFDLPTGNDANIALAVLTQIIHDPQYLGRAAVSEPKGFDWDGHNAAYYLLNTGDGNVTMLVAVIIQKPQRLIVCNISSPDERSQSIRVMLPTLLATLTINGVVMDTAAVNALPVPLVFPAYAPPPEATSETASSW